MRRNYDFQYFVLSHLRRTDLVLNSALQSDGVSLIAFTECLKKNMCIIKLQLLSVCQQSVVPLCIVIIIKAIQAGKGIIFYIIIIEAIVLVIIKNINI